MPQIVEELNNIKEQNSHGNKAVQSFLQIAKPKLFKGRIITKIIGSRLAQALRNRGAKINEAGIKVQSFLDKKTLDEIVSLQKNVIPQMVVKGIENLPTKGGFLVNVDHGFAHLDGVSTLSVLRQHYPDAQIKVMGTSELIGFPFIQPVNVRGKSGSKSDNIMKIHEEVVTPLLNERGIGLLAASGAVQRAYTDEELIKMNPNHPELQITREEREINEFRHSFRYVQSARLYGAPLVFMHIDAKAPREIYNLLGNKGVSGWFDRAKAMIDFNEYDFPEFNVEIRKPIYKEQLMEIYSLYGYNDTLSKGEKRKIDSKITAIFQEYQATGGDVMDLVNAEFNGNPSKEVE